MEDIKNVKDLKEALEEVDEKRFIVLIIQLNDERIVKARVTKLDIVCYDRIHLLGNEY